MKKQYALLFAGLLALSSLALAKPGMDGEGPEGEKGMGGMHGGGPEKMFKGLDLSKEQKEKLKALHRARRDANQKRGDAMEDARESLKEALLKTDNSPAYAATLKAKNEEVMKLMQDAGRDRFEGMLEVRSILTPAQLKKFVEMAPGGMHDKMGGRGKEGKRGKMGKERGPREDKEDDDKHDHESK